MVGLIKALNNFDYNLGVCFSTYAVPMIVGEIKRCLRDRTGIKVSRSLRDTAYKALRAREMLEDGNKEPLMEEIAQEIGVSLSEVACALDAVSDTLSFYDPVFGNDVEEGMMLLDQIADQKENSDKWAENIALEEALAIVPEREIQIVKMRYYEGKTQVEISAMTGISQAQVSRLEKSAINRLRRCLCE
jgi:RNA polymerase sporulation-specific sigma factor